jgi:hypothetical protein
MLPKRLVANRGRSPTRTGDATKKYFLRKVELVSENVDQHFYEKS